MSWAHRLWGVPGQPQIQGSPGSVLLVTTWQQRGVSLPCSLSCPASRTQIHSHTKGFKAFPGGDL